MKNYRLAGLYLLLIIITASCTTNRWEPGPGYEKIQNSILFMEHDPPIDGSKLDENRKILTWMMHCNMKLIWDFPVEIYSTYPFYGDLLMGFNYGILFYSIKNFYSFSTEDEKVREFNINAVIRGFKGMIKWYDGIIKAKGEAARVPIMEKIKEEQNTPAIRSRAEKIVQTKIDRNGYEWIFVYIQKPEPVFY